MSDQTEHDSVGPNGQASPQQQQAASYQSQPTRTATKSLEDIFHEEEVKRGLPPPPEDQPEPQLTTIRDPRFADTITTDIRCKTCSNLTRRICPTCKGAYCRDCASILDPTYCNVCLRENAAEISYSPLPPDADGVVHNGQTLKVTGPAFGTTAKRVSEMTDYELDAHIDLYKHLIRQAETVLDFRRIHVGGMQLEREQRGEAKRRALRGFKMPRPSAPQQTASGKPPALKTPQPSPDILLQMVKAIQLGMALKAQKKTQPEPQQTQSKTDQK